MLPRVEGSDRGGGLAIKLDSYSDAGGKSGSQAGKWDQADTVSIPNTME
jgi:hypothetical protein